MSDIVSVSIPSENALKAYNLSRYVESPRKHTNSNENPFISVVDRNSREKDMNTATLAGDSKSHYMNEVILDVAEYTPVRIITEQKGNVVQAKLEYGGSAHKDQEIIASFRILLDNPNVQLSYNHTWQAPTASLLSSLYNKVNEVVTDGAMLINAAQNAAAAASLIGYDSKFNVAPISKIDYQKVYQDTAYPEVTLEFKAFASEQLIV
jgi:hypothetical protein